MCGTCVQQIHFEKATVEKLGDRQNADDAHVSWRVLAGGGDEGKRKNKQPPTGQGDATTGQSRQKTCASLAYREREGVVDDVLHVGNVQPPRRHIRRNHERPFFRLELRKSALAVGLADSEANVTGISQRKISLARQQRRDAAFFAFSRAETFKREKHFR